MYVSDVKGVLQLLVKEKKRNEPKNIEMVYKAELKGDIQHLGLYIPIYV